MRFSRRKCEVVRIQTSTFANPERRIKQKHRDGLVPDGPATFHRPHKLLLLFGLQYPWRFLWQILAPHIRPSKSEEQVEIVKGGERQDSRGGLSLARFLEMTLEIPNRVMARVWIAERVAVIVRTRSEIGAISPDPTQISPTSVQD